jgi:predicted MFS family arabinose efflux permease
MTRTTRLGQRYAYVVAAVAFTALLVAAGLRSAPGVLMIPWQADFGWDKATISLAAAIGILLFGLMGPFAAALMQQWGVRKTLVSALALMAVSTGLSLFMTRPWQLIATWGVMSGLASGCVAVVFAATIVNRWFVANRGLMSGVLTASTSTGYLIFLPLMAQVSKVAGWKPVVAAIALAAAALIPVVLWLLPDRPSDVGTEPYGAPVGAPPPAPTTANPLALAFAALGRAVRRTDFWLLFGTFFVCGFTTNGLVGTHMVSLCSDRGLAITTATGVMAWMGFFDLFGTTASGWLTDRFDARRLLFAYYVLRGLSLIYLPYSDFSLVSLGAFAAFYGLDWIATVPPTLKLTNAAFGEREAPIVFGWIAAGHQIGAASAALMAGVLRTATGTYLEAFVIAGLTAVAAGVAALFIGRGRTPGPVLAAA